ncbi:hypothetical protein [Amphibacillus sediminis]|uniref:hypothetical protein n=1 Tax=Amphibacillus sediminis TaxID=360185 RepID=UPI000836E437|nr:hypothetical protein [Amphibacillus sediminis]
MTVKPINQFSVLHERLKQGKFIKDCYRLLYQRELWQELRTSYHTKSWQRSRNHDLSKLLFALRSSNWGTIAQMIKRTWVMESLIYVIELLFISPCLRSAYHSSPEQSLNHIKANWENVHWVIKLRYQSRPNTFTNRICHLIDDQRFIKLISLFFSHLQQSQKERFNGLCLAIQLSQHVIYPQALPITSSSCFYCFSNQTVYLALICNKNSTLLLVERLKEKLASDYSIHFHHFSKPIRLAGYSIRYSQRHNCIRFEITKQALEHIAQLHQYGSMCNKKPYPRGALIHLPIDQIANIYARECFVVACLFKYADNYSFLGQLFYFAQLSLLRTIALKKGCSVTKAGKWLKEQGYKPIRLPKQPALFSFHVDTYQLASRIH